MPCRLVPLAEECGFLSDPFEKETLYFCFYVVKQVCFAFTFTKMFRGFVCSLDDKEPE